MLAEQQGDVLLVQTNNDGEIQCVNGTMTMTPGLENAVYLSLFGGNDLDSGSDGNRNEYWGNFMVELPANKYRSETQFLLTGLPAVTGNIKQIHDAVLRDLNWMLEAGVANSVEATVTMPGLNRVLIVVTINGESDSNLSFEENWLASMNR